MDNIKMGLVEIGWCGVVWTGLVWLRIGKKLKALVNAVMNFRVPQNAEKLSSGCIADGLSSGTQLYRVS
jgi:hypothetical protein